MARRRPEALARKELPAWMTDAAARRGREAERDAWLRANGVDLVDLIRFSTWVKSGRNRPLSRAEAVEFARWDVV